METQIEYVTPPLSIIEPCKKPSINDIITNRDLAIYASELSMAFDMCAAKISALKVFFDNYKVEENE